MEAMESALEDKSGPIPASQAIQGFVDAALSRYPEIDETSSAECPWASSPLIAEASGDFIYFPMTFSGAEFARDVIAEIANSLGLVCFDPQIEQLLPDVDAVPASTVSASAYAALAQHLQAEQRAQEPSWFTRLFKRKQRSDAPAHTTSRIETHGASLRATLESGEIVDDPSKDGLFMLLESVEAERSGYLIVDDLRDPSGQTYAQSSRNGDGTYVVEYRAGRADQHFRTAVPDMRAAHTVITGWAFDLPGWREITAWEPVKF